MKTNWVVFSFLISHFLTRASQVPAIIMEQNQKLKPTCTNKQISFRIMLFFCACTFILVRIGLINCIENGLMSAKNMRKKLLIQYYRSPELCIFNQFEES